MNSVPFAVGAVVVLAVPPFRRRVVPVAFAAAGAVGGVAITAASSAIALGEAVAEGTVNVTRAVIVGPDDQARAS